MSYYQSQAQVYVGLTHFLFVCEQAENCRIAHEESSSEGWLLTVCFKSIHGSYSSTSI